MKHFTIIYHKKFADLPKYNFKGIEIFHLLLHIKNLNGMTKEIFLISAVSTFDSWKTSKKDVLFAESTEKEAIKTIERFTKKVENENHVEGCKIRYIYEKINYYEKN